MEFFGASPCAPDTHACVVVVGGRSGMFLTSPPLSILIVDGHAVAILAPSRYPGIVTSQNMAETRQVLFGDDHRGASECVQ